MLFNYLVYLSAPSDLDHCGSSSCATPSLHLRLERHNPRRTFFCRPLRANHRTVSTKARLYTLLTLLPPSLRPYSSEVRGKRSAAGHSIHYSDTEDHAEDQVRSVLLLSSNVQRLFLCLLLCTSTDCSLLSNETSFDAWCSVPPQEILRISDLVRLRSICESSHIRL